MSNSGWNPFLDLWNHSSGEQVTWNAHVFEKNRAVSIPTFTVCRSRKSGPKIEVLEKNELGEPCLATPAISQGVLYFRTPAPATT